MYTFAETLIKGTGENRSTLGEVKEGLRSGERKRIMGALHVLSRHKISSKQRMEIFPLVVRLILHNSLEIKSAIYSFILRSIEVDKTLLLLAVNTILQEMQTATNNTPACAIQRSLSLGFISKVQDKEFLSHFYDEIEKSYKSSSEMVQRSALMCAPTLFRMFQEVDTEVIKGSLTGKGAPVISGAIHAIVEIEKEKKGVFGENTLLQCLSVLCQARTEIEDSFGNFTLLFIELCRLLRPFPRKEVFENIFPTLKYLSLFSIREMIISGEKYMIPSLAEKIADSIICFLCTDEKMCALETIHLLVNMCKVKLNTLPFLITGADDRKEKILKIKIISKISENEGLNEIRAFLRDKDCSFHVACTLLTMDALREEDIRIGFRYCPSSMLKAIYVKHPLPDKHSSTVKEILQSMSNVTEKEAYLYLCGWYLSSIPDEAKRIRRIRNSAGGVLYGKKEEREKAEEHLEEYLYFLLNLYIRGVLSREECLANAQDAFSEEPFLLSKFMHIIDIPDRSKILELISFKRISYKLAPII